MTEVTQAAALKKFEELSMTFGGSGYMVSTIPSEYYEILKTKNWKERYDSDLAGDRPFSSLNCYLDLFGEKISLRFDTPCEIVYKYEFQDHFGFQADCIGYNPETVVVVFKRRPTQPELITKITREYGSVKTPIDNNFAVKLLMVMLLEGHVKKWTAIDMMANWFVEAGIKSCTNFVEEKVWLKYILQHMIEPKT